jgi:hypothetical protein
MVRSIGIRSTSTPAETSALSCTTWLSRVMTAGKNRLWYCRELRIYRYPLSAVPPLPLPTIFRRNCLDDLQYYERTSKEQQPPDTYRKMAVERLEQGFHLYTFVEDNRLLHYAWLIERQTRGEDGWVDQAYFPPPDTAVLFDHFTHPVARGRGLYHQALCRLLHDARTIARARQAYVTVFGSNGPSRHVIEKVGFQHAGSLFKERRLIWSRRYAVSAGGAFPTSLL